MAQQFDINKRLMALMKNEIQAQKQMNSLAKQKSQLESNFGECASSWCVMVQQPTNAIITNNSTPSKATCKMQRLQRELDKITDLEQIRRQELENRKALIKAIQDQLAANRQYNAQLLQESARLKEDHQELMGK